MDVIESGEIVEPRSLVIRSQKAPVITYDEPTETTHRPVAPRSRIAVDVIVFAAAVACAGAAVMLALRAKQPDGSALEGPAAMLATTLDGEAQATKVRADGIAASPVLRAAIATDAGTLADMARDRDIALSLRPTDVVEVVQVRAGQRAVLLRLPADARPLVAPPAGRTRVETGAGHVVVIANAGIGSERSEMHGEIVLSTTVDLAAAAKRISEHASGAVLTGLREPIVLIPSATAPNVQLPIKTTTADAGSLALAAVVPEPSGIYAWVCMAASALLLAILGVRVIRARRAIRTRS